MNRTLLISLWGIAVIVVLAALGLGTFAEVATLLGACVMVAVAIVLVRKSRRA